MKEFLIDFWERDTVRKWAEEYNDVTIATTTKNSYVKLPSKDANVVLTSSVSINDDELALMFYLTFRETLIYEPATPVATSRY